MTQTTTPPPDDVTPQAEQPQDPLIADGFNYQDLGASEDAPPAYGDVMDQLQLSQSGFNAGAAVTDDGRVNININQTSRKLTDLLAPTLGLGQQRPPDQPAAGPLPPPYIPPSLGGQPGQTPPPKLNVVIQIVGSRGDVQPFVALGQVLRDTYGHRVRLATHPTFQKFVEENGLEFFSIGGDPAELMAFMVKNPGLMPGFDALKSGEITKRRQGIEQIVLGCWRSCIESGNGLGPPPDMHKPNEPLDERFTLPGNPNDRPFVADAIIANPPSFAHIHLAEKLGIPLHIMFTMPWSPTKSFPHPLANIQSSNTDEVMTNYMSYALVEMMTWQGLGDVINRFRTKILNLAPLSLIWAPGLLTRLRIPTTYCWSPALIPKPQDWAPEVSIAGFFFLNLATSYTPEPDLAAFLESGPPPVYIGFGSIVVDDPNRLTRIIFDAISMTGVRALVSKGWGGIGADSVGIPDGVFMLGNCPHDWLFKHVSAVVHHGGAGTSAAGINLGRPTVVVPFFGDQPFWGSMIARAGAGPEPIPFSKLTAENLAAAIREAIKPETRNKAEELGAKIRQEKGADVGGKSFHEFLDVSSMRCSVAPSRAAVWRVRRTQTRLSPLAAAVLVQAGKVEYSDLKLLRVKEYHTEGQPWDPITACSSALVGDISEIGMAIADVPRELFRSRARATSSHTQPSSDGQPKATPSQSSLAPSESAASQHRSTGSDAASMTSTRPSDMARTSTDDTTSRTATGITSPDPASTPASAATPVKPPPETPLTFGTAVNTGRSVSRIVQAGIRTPLNFSMGLAQGFRNAPKLYNDDTIRPVEKVDSFASGLKVAGKEFGLGLYDGISGLVTQPIRGAEKEGGIGLIKGFGKGIGGVVLKSGAAIWSIPAYTMQGVHAEVQALFSRSAQNFIITSRVLQGKEDLAASTPQERRDIVLRFEVKSNDLKSFYTFKQKKQKGKQPADPNASGTPSDEEPKTGWLHTRGLSIDERKKLHEQKEAWKRRQTERAIASTSSTSSASGAPATPYFAEDSDVFEQAIRQSVQQTSRGNAEEDARVEQSIRTSVTEMRRIAQFSRDEKRPITDTAELDGTQGLVDLENITDEEFQALIDLAVQQSITEQSRRVEEEDDDDDDVAFLATIEESKVYQNYDPHEEDMKRALEESKNYEDEDAGRDEEELKRIMAESEKTEQARRAERERDQTEEDIVLEYVKKQSLAEDELRRKHAKGKGIGRDDMYEDDDNDDELKRALEESLRLSGKKGEPSSHRIGQAKDSQEAQPRQQQKEQLGLSKTPEQRPSGHHTPEPRPGTTELE